MTDATSDRTIDSGKGARDSIAAAPHLRQCSNLTLDAVSAPSWRIQTIHHQGQAVNSVHYWVGVIRDFTWCRLMSPGVAG